MLKVYLAGPISGLDYGESVSWRDEATRLLGAAGITAYSPMRNKEHLKNAGVLEQSYPKYALSSDRGIMSRDHHDVITADALLVNLTDVKRVSVGTAMEIAWAWDRHIPTVVMMEDPATGGDGRFILNPHDHPMIREAIGWRVKTLEEAVHCVKSVLLPQ